MKVILATAKTPFVRGGDTFLIDWLEEELVARGHEVETYRIPVYPSADDLGAQLVGLRMWDFTGHGDRLITVRTPSYLIKHHSKVVWFLHHHRPAYDLWSQYREVPDDNFGREFRRMMFVSDEVGLAECEHIFVNSAQVQDRLRRFNDIESEVLYPPLGASIELPVGPVGDTLVYVSRVVPHKRQLLAVQAMAHTTTEVKLVIAGTSPDEEYLTEIRTEIEEQGLADRVRFIEEFVREDVKADLYKQSLGVVYLPYDEDSYGFVGLEAAAAHKPLVTTKDSGGVPELVQHGISGYICEPDPTDLARAFDELYSHRIQAGIMGKALAARTHELGIRWDHVIDRLLA
jgi:glycosyltransferase involved in cell wall biosynthesis